MFGDFCSENRTVYEIMWENVVQRDRPQMKIWRMRIACWIPKATNTHLQHVILIALFGKVCRTAVRHTSPILKY